MSSLTKRYLIAVALSYGASIVLYEADLADAEAARLIRLLGGLMVLGHIATFTVEEPGPMMDGAAVLAALRHRWDFVLDAVLASAETHRDPLPAYLMPVWPFDHERQGKPASTARFLHLDLEVIATLTPDEEVGVSLAGRSGCWLVHARPYCSDKLADDGPQRAATDH